MFKKFLSIVLSTALFAASMAAFANAYEIAYDDEWVSYYSSVDNTLPLLTPGSDESELYITWHSSADSPACTVKIATDSAMTQDVRLFDASAASAETDLQRVNRAVITGLEENTHYYYSYTLSDGTYSAPAEYNTHDSSDFSVLVTSDAQIGPASDGADRIMNDAYLWNETINAALNMDKDLSFIIHNGDQTQVGSDPQEWVGLYSPAALRNIPIATVIGNHDKKGTMYKYYTSCPNPYNMDFPSDIGSVNWYRYGDVLFVNFDSTNGSASDQYAVAKEATEANPDVRWIVGCMHHDLYGSTNSAASAESTVLFKNIFAPIFDEFDFDVVFTGHSHTYGRSHQIYGDKVIYDTTGISEVTDPEGTVYISTCRAGDEVDTYDNAPHAWTSYRYEDEDIIYTLADFSDDSLSVKTYRLANDELVDEYRIIKTADSHAGDGSELRSDSWFSTVRSLGAVYMFFSKIVDMFKNFSIPGLIG